MFCYSFQPSISYWNAVCSSLYFYFSFLLFFFPLLSFILFFSLFFSSFYILFFFAFLCLPFFYLALFSNPWPSLFSNFPMWWQLITPNSRQNLVPKIAHLTPKIWETCERNFFSLVGFLANWLKKQFKIKQCCVRINQIQVHKPMGLVNYSMGHATLIVMSILHESSQAMPHNLTQIKWIMSLPITHDCKHIHKIALKKV